MNVTQLTKVKGCAFLNGCEPIKSDWVRDLDTDRHSLDLGEIRHNFGRTTTHPDGIN